MAAIERRGIGFRARIRIKGSPPQTAVFERLTDARRWAQQTEAAIREGRHFKTTEAKKHTVEELIDRYIRDLIPQKKRTSQGTQKAQLQWWKKQIGAYLLSNVTPALLAECKDRLAFIDEERKVARSPSTVVRYLAVLSHAFTMAVPTRWPRRRSTRCTRGLRWWRRDRSARRVPPRPDVPVAPEIEPHRWRRRRRARPQRPPRPLSRRSLG
jgi:hypothetical protein